MSDNPGLPPEEDQDLQIEGSVTMCSAEVVETEEDDICNDEQFYCEECLKFYLEQCDLHGPPAFTHDSPTPLGVPQRALLTLPPGLVIGRSSSPGAGLGVFNQCHIVPVGMHFGPYDGEVTSRERALDSAYSWVICTGDEYVYIDAEKDTHSNWMRYVVCSRNEEEQNLVAFQQDGRVLFRCCRPIPPGQELKVWYSEEYAKGLGAVWDQLWHRKCSSAGNSPGDSQVFPCSLCQHTFPAQSYLHQHLRRSHPHDYQPYEETLVLQPLSPSPVMDADQCLLASDAPPPTQIQPITGTGQNATLNGQGLCRSETSANSHSPQHALQVRSACSNGPSGTDTGCPDWSTEASGEESHKCDECGRRFVRSCHLKRHQRTIHSKEKPYCCSQCKRCFSQATGLKRHQQIHQGETERGAAEEEAQAPFDVFPCSQCSFSFVAKLNLHKHLKRHHNEEYLRLVENGSVTTEAPASPPEQVDKSDPPYEPPATMRRSALSPLRNRSKRGRTGRPRGRPPSKAKQRARLKLARETAQAEPGPGSPVSQQEPRQEPRQAPPQPEAEGADPPRLGSHVCGECRRPFGHLDALRAHECIQVGESPHGCLRCSLYFTRLCNLRRHQRTVHSKERPYCCGLCFKAFTQSSSLKRHQESHARRKARRHCGALADATIFPCPHCPFSFTGERYLHKHIRRHHPQERAELRSSGAGAGGSPSERSCGRCSRSFRSLKGFKSHSCFQQGEKVYLCPDCGKGFSWFNSLKQHQRIHTGEKPYGCSQCGKSFVHSGQLNVHLRTHTGEKPFLCAECGESFRQSGDLKRHERKHTGVRPCQCQECGKRFSRPQSLRAHQQLHSGKKLYACSQCGKGFTRRYHLTRHHQKMHS